MVVPIVETDLYLYVGRISLAFGISMKIDLSFVWVIQIDLISVRGMEFTWISV